MLDLKIQNFISPVLFHFLNERLWVDVCVMFYISVFKLLSVCVNICHCMCLPVTSPLSTSLTFPPSVHLSLHHFLSVWVSMQSDPGELITVGACKAGTKTLHRQHNSCSRNQTGSTQSSLTGPAQISSVQPSHTQRMTNTTAAFHSARLNLLIIKIRTSISSRLSTINT